LIEGNSKLACGNNYSSGKVNFEKERNQNRKKKTGNVSEYIREVAGWNFGGNIDHTDSIFCVVFRSTSWPNAGVLSK
jgi:hypothetical protein